MCMCLRQQKRGNRDAIDRVRACRLVGMRAEGLTRGNVDVSSPVMVDVFDRLRRQRSLVCGCGAVRVPVSTGEATEMSGGKCDGSHGACAVCETIRKGTKCETCEDDCEPGLCKTMYDASYIDHVQRTRIAVLVAQRDEAVHIGRDLITWARGSGVAIGAVIDAERRLDVISPRPFISHACVSPKRTSTPEKE